LRPKGKHSTPRSRLRQLPSLRTSWNFERLNLLVPLTAAMRSGLSCAWINPDLPPWNITVKKSRSSEIVRKKIVDDPGGPQYLNIEPRVG
jgi:hypothetical protein